MNTPDIEWAYGALGIKYDPNTKQYNITKQIVDEHFRETSRVVHPDNFSEEANKAIATILQQSAQTAKDTIYVHHNFLAANVTA